MILTLNENLNEEISEETENIIEESENLDTESTEDEEINDKIFGKKLIITVIIFAASALIYLAARIFPCFAEFWTKYPAQWIRFILAKISDILPFSFAESVLIILPIFLILYIVGSIVKTKNDKGNAGINKWIRPLIAFILVIGTLFCLAFGPAFGRNTVAENLGLDRQPVNAEELFETTKILSDMVKPELSDIKFDSSGSSIMPYGYDTLVTKMNESFEKYSNSADYISHFKSKPKAVALSGIMTYTHISGVYTFMTGEANINTNYPDFLIPFTMAHEMAHQRGIAREDEANFVAYLVCINSDDEYIRYSGYSNMINYTLSALADADKEKHKEFILNYMPIKVYYEFVAYSRFFDKYRDSTASVVADKVNDAVIKTNGQAAGSRSYGLVVDLAVAYYKNK